MINPKMSNVHFSRLFIRLFFKLLVLTFPAWGILFFTVLMLGVLFSVTEEISFFNSLYFTFITAMTVRYGDITPDTDLGKVLSVCMGIFGIVTTGIIVAIALQALKMAYEKSNKNANREQTTGDRDRRSL
ncbi:potassium channel family protein [Chitinispirillales bacterium ANBcel5]|uniref:potassium channel family protein n=1 Tax=Cellulosispirillum alkaliphilum TaxID=3039283 RepID=UPI002A530C92|nr:potassium channel family protein [Chitinispirillales bacterium ANBcel5]